MVELPDYNHSRRLAIQQYDAAFHLLKVTFPVAKDPKLLIGVINNIFQSLEYSMEAILGFERHLKLVPPYSDNFQSKFNMFRYKCVKRNDVPISVINLVMELRDLLDLHKRSPMEFQRGNKFVICNREYGMKIISIGKIQEYLDENKKMLDAMETTLNKFDQK